MLSSIRNLPNYSTNHLHHVSQVSQLGVYLQLPHNAQANNNTPIKMIIVIMQSIDVRGLCD